MRNLFILFLFLMGFVGANEPARAVSTNPLVGANYIVLNSSGNHDLFSGSYDAQSVENTLSAMQNMGMKYVRVFDGPILTGDPNNLQPVLPATTRSNIIDFFNRAQSHGLTVYFQFSLQSEPWLVNQYQLQTNQYPTEYYSEYTSVGQSLYAQRITYIISQCIAGRTENVVLSLINEPQISRSIVNPSSSSVAWTNYMIDQIRTVDNRANHQITVALRQRTTSPGGDYLPNNGNYLWNPGDLFNFTKVDFVDMHFYHLDTAQTSTQEFDSYFGWWAQFSSKPVWVSEMGAPYYMSNRNEKVAAQDLLSTIHYIRNNSAAYSKIANVLMWSMVPYYGTYEVINSSTGVGVPDGPFYRLTDGYQGYTRLGTSIWNDQYIEPTFATNYPTSVGYPASSVDDYNDSTYSVIQNVPSSSAPNELTITYTQWYQIHKIRIVDNVLPYPKDFDVLVEGSSGWVVFQSVRGNTQSTVDLTSSQPGGWQSGYAVKIRVFDEQGNWSTLSGVYLNPVTVNVQ